MRMIHFVSFSVLENERKIENTVREENKAELLEGKEHSR